MSLAQTQNRQSISPASMRGTAWFLAGATLLFLAVWLAPTQLTSAGLAGYAPLHTSMETFAIVVSMLIFGVAWNAYSGERPGNVLILACGFLAVGLIDFVHTLSYAGMPDFVTPAGPEKAINFWLAARLLAAGTLLLIALRRWKPVPSLAARYLLLATSLAVTGLVCWAGLYHADLLPRMFVAGKGLTTFKVGTEYFIIAVLAAAAWHFHRQVRQVGSLSALYLFAACAVSVLSELCFTLYSDVADLFNVLGHLYKIAAYALIYRVVFVDSVRSPFERLARARQETEQRIAERTADLDQANISLRDSSARIGAILDTVADGIITIDERGSVETVNPAAERIFGYAAAEVMGHNVNMLMPEPYHGEHDGYLDRYRATGEARFIGIVREVVGQRKDGSTFPMELGVSEMWLGGERHFTGVVRDISARKQAEDQLNRFFTLSLDMLCISSADGYFKRVSPAFTHTLGWSTEEILARPFLDFVHPEDHATTLREVERQAVAGEKVLHFENRYAHKDGSWRVLSWVSTPHAGGLMFATARDVTEQKRIEEKLRVQSEEIARKNLELEAANRAKSDFLANMSHELRTPLNAIIGFSEMLKDGVLGALEAKQQEFVGDIFGAGTHLLSLINDILDLSKVEAGMLQLDAAAVDVTALLKASTLVVREKAMAHRIRLDTRLDPALGSMLADERKLKQMVYNLLSNAVKFTPEGGTVTLYARRCARTEVAFDEAMPARLLALPPGEHGEFLAITVEDSGVGIAEADLQKLYEPFMQVDSAIARRHAGTGLGLSLVRRLAELHGGTVGVASRPGAGSRFCVWLPYREAAAAAPADRLATEAGVSTEPGATIPSAHAGAASIRVAPPLALVIEDDDQVADLIAAQLHLDGYQVMRAATGEEGLVRAAKRRPQLITLDIFLPAMDGWEFLRHLKADARLADTPVVIISVADGLDHGLALGARRVLQKPFTREELVTALAGLIEAPRSEGAPARVLVVDDNVKAVELVAGVLEREGYQALRAYGGAEAIETVRRARPDLVILDLMMPEVSGFEVARALRASEHTARIPILVLTAKDLTPEERARLNGAVSAILQKSDFSHDELLAELRRAIAMHRPD